MQSSKKFHFLLIPALLVFYFGVVVGQEYGLFERFGARPRTEIFPFFSWSLFSSPDRDISVHYIEVLEVDGKRRRRPHNLIGPGRVGILMQKVVRSNISNCNRKGLEQCSSRVKKEVVPFINRVHQYRSLTFKILRCSFEYEHVKQVFQDADVTIPKITDCDEEISQGPWTVGQ